MPSDVRRRGFVLLPVALTLALTATLAYQLNRRGGSRVRQAANQANADKARYLAEAGFAHAKWALAQTTRCTGYQDLAQASFGGGSYSVAISPQVGSPVMVAATGLLPGGETVRLRRADVVVRGAPHVLTLQPDPTAAKDTHLDHGSPNNSYGDGDHLDVESKNFITERAPLLQFDLSMLPACTQVLSARLNVYLDGGAAVSGSSNRIDVQRISRPWVEGTKRGAPGDGATWNTSDAVNPWTSPGGDVDPTVWASWTFDKTVGWKTWDVTALVSAWVSGTFPNHGLRLWPTGPDLFGHFISSDKADRSAWWPTLALVYRAPCGAPIPVSTYTVPPLADAQLDSSKPSTNYGATSTLKCTGSSSKLPQKVVAKFDVSGIPAGNLVQSARLRFYVSGMAERSGAPVTVSVFALTEAWAEGTQNGSGTADGATWTSRSPGLDWAAPGGTYRTPAIAAVTIPTTFDKGWIEFDVLALVQEWLDGVSSNHGVALVTLSQDVLSIDSRENGNQPQLTVTY